MKTTASHEGSPAPLIRTEASLPFAKKSINLIAASAEQIYSSNLARRKSSDPTNLHNHVSAFPWHWHLSEVKTNFMPIGRPGSAAFQLSLTVLTSCIDVSHCSSHHDHSTNIIHPFTVCGSQVDHASDMWIQKINGARIDLISGLRKANAHGKKPHVDYDIDLAIPLLHEDAVGGPDQVGVRTQHVNLLQR